MYGKITSLVHFIKIIISECCFLYRAWGFSGGSITDIITRWSFNWRGYTAKVAVSGDLGSTPYDKLVVTTKVVICTLQSHHYCGDLEGVRKQELK